MRRERKRGKKGIRYWIGTAAGLLLMMALAVSVMASAYDPDQNGSITVQMANKAAGDTEQSAKLAGLEFYLYKVGATDASKGSPGYVIDKDLAAANVDIDALSTTKGGTSEMARKAAYKLLAVARSIGMNPVDTKTLSADGNVYFTDLEQGLYILTKGAGDEDVIVFPSFLAIPSIERVASDGADAQVSTNTLTLNYDLVITPKIEISSERGSVQVTKDIKFRDPNTNTIHTINSENITTSVNFGLFYDDEGIAPVIIGGEEQRKTLVIQGNSSNTLVFDNIPVGTYYILECDENWNPVMLAADGENETSAHIKYVTYVSGDFSDAKTCEIEFDLSAPESAWTKKVGVENIYTSELPDGLFLNAKIQITKKVVQSDGSTKDNAEDYTFYAGIFTLGKDEKGAETEDLFEMVELKTNGTVEIPVTLGGDDYTEPITYRIYEMEKVGETEDGQEQFAFVNGDFPFECSIVEGKDVKLEYDANSSEDPIGTLTITNKRKPGPTSTPRPSKAPTKTPTPPSGEQTPPPEEDEWEPTPRVVIISQPPVNIRTDGTSTVVHNTTTTTGTTTSVRTGDDTPIALYVILLAAAAGIVIFVIVRKKKK